MNGLDPMGDDYILNVWVILSMFFCIHTCVFKSMNKFLFSFLPATICSPLGTLIMANECFQAQSLIYLHRPKT